MITYDISFQTVENTKIMKCHVKVKDTTSNGMVWYQINKSKVDEPKVKDFSKYENPEKDK